MPNALETPWVTLKVNDVPLSLYNDLGRPNLRMISRSSFFVFFFLPPLPGPAAVFELLGGCLIGKLDKRRPLAL